MKLKDVIKTEDEIKSLGHSIENNIITKVDINIIGHFGNCASLEIVCPNVIPLSGYNNTKNIGYMLRAFIELFELEEENGKSIFNIKIPCRLIFENDGGWGGRCIGFGHIIQDKFILRDDFVQINE